MANSPSYGSTPASDRSAAPAPTPDLAADATALASEAKSAAGKIVDEAREQAESLADRAKSELSDATGRAKSMAADQKELLAAQVGGVAEAMERAASDLEQNNGTSAHYARMIADNAEKLSSTIRDNDVDQLLGMAQDFGRRQPALFVGAAALLGFAASRFVMASAKRRDEQTAAAAGDRTATDYRDYPGEPASGSRMDMGGA